jgi:hypothetical protein
MHDRQQEETATRDRLDEIEAHVRRRLNGRLLHFRLTIQDDGLVLEGMAHNFYSK